MEKADKILLAMLQDKIDQSYKTCITTNTGFLDVRQKNLVNSYCKKIKGLSYEFYGGYEEAERCICMISLEDESEREQLAALRIVKSGTKALTHRDYMGSILGLGIKRELVGDILVHADGADIIILKELADFFVCNYEKAGSTPIKVEIISTNEVKTSEENVEEIRQSVSSLRLDNMISSVFKLSRSNAVEAINGGLVYINGQQVTKPDKTLNKGDKLVLRGKGKAILQDVLGSSKKDKTVILIKKFK
ncbi:MAG: RNA-binding protein [Peptostreptococcaceae bacterium]|nr:RNA-binding protein [Peptostreptococcaceae bacterium]